MFEFEDSDIPAIKRNKTEDYDFDYAMAVSKSLLETTGSQVLSPEEVQNIIDTKITEIIENNKKLNRIEEK
jgi:hypothetical protein